MRIVFIGTVEFSRQCLEWVLECGGNVVAIFTMTRKAARFNTDYSDLGPIASRENIPLYRMERINEEHNIEAIRSLEPDVIFVFGFSQIIAREILDIPPLGCIGTHPALLPRNRGRHPIIWALIEDLSESGLTFFILDEGADSGDIVWHKRFHITDEDDAGTLYRKITDLAREGISEILPMVQQGEIKRSVQDHSKATYWRKRVVEDGEIQWKGTARQVWNLVRSLTHPYVGAHTFQGDRKLIIWRASILKSDDLHISAGESRPGTILTVSKEGPLVMTADGIVKIEEWDGPAGFTFEQGTTLGREEA